MAIALATSPALVKVESTTATTSSFSPAAGTLLVAQVAAFADTSAPSVSSGGGLTWTRRIRRDDGGGYYAEIWTAPCAAGATNITVTATAGSTFPMTALKVDVWTGASLSSPAGNTGSGATTTNNATVNGYTSSQAGSRGVAVAICAGETTAPTSTDELSAWSDSNGSSGLAVRKAANTGSSGTVVQFNLDAPGSAATDWQWAALEIKPGSIDATVDAATVDATADIPAPGLGAGATASPATMDALASIATPGVHAGQSIPTATVTATAAIPTPSVTAGSTELVEPGTVTAVADIDDPAITAVSNATTSPAVVDAVADIPSPAVTATFQATITPDPVDAIAAIPTPTLDVPFLPGQAITGDFQIEWAGQLYGGYGNVYQVLSGSVEGWDTLPGLDSDSALRPSRHGAWPGRSIGQQREVSAIIAVDDPDNFVTSLRALRRITTVANDDSEYALVIRTYGESLLAFGSISARSIPITDYQTGWAQVSLRWICSDPRRYDLAQLSVVVTAGGSQAIANDGDTDTSPRFRILGPATNPALVNETLDRVLGFDLTLTTGQLLEINTQLGTVEVDGVSSMNALSSESVPVEDFVIAPGENVVHYETDSGGTAGAETIWRFAYL